MSTRGEITMFFARSFIGRSMLAALLMTAAPFAFAQAPAADLSVVHTAGEPGLQWGGCPAFLPKGCGLAVLHGDPSKPNADLFLKVPGKSTIPLHTHTSPERMVLVSGELHVTYDGQKMTVLKAGSYAYGPAKLPHKGYCASKAPCVLFIAFEAPVDAIPVETAAK
jgi:hypothetical protein